MSDETEKNSGEGSEGKESNAMGQDDISKLIDEMQGEENSSEIKDQTEKTTDKENKQKSDETKDDKSEGKESSNLNQDDISKLIDEVQSEEKSSVVEEQEETTENVEKDNEVEKNDETEISEDENTQTAESNDDNVEEKEIVKKEGSQEKDEKPVEKDEESTGENEESVKEDKKPEKETDETGKKEKKDEKDNDSFKGLDSEDEIDGDPDTEPDTEKDESDNEDNDNNSKKNDKDIENKKDNSNREAVIVKEVKKRFTGKRFKLFISCILCVVITGALFGVYIFIEKSKTYNVKLGKPLQSEQIAKQAGKYSEEQTRQQIEVNETKDILLSDSIIAKLEEITKLRNELLIKEGEIADLIKSYKNSISEMEDEILRVKRNTKVDSFSVAIKNKKIEFGMMTIQRRLAYIEKIEPPYNWLNQGIEELLYLKRKIEIDARISRVISGIDMNKMIQEIDIVTQSYRTGIENLKIDMKNVELMPFEMIWKRIIDKEKISEANIEKDDEPVGRNKTVFANEGKNNRMIWEEICSGNFKRKNEMTKLSTEAAKCLSKWKQSDLFLNGLTELSPKVARHLLKWKGNWICLNGVKKISPEAAKNLFHWQGNWISLNGISEISSGLLRYLPQWQGKQLELMGLKYKRSNSTQIGLKSLAKWEKAGGKLYIPVQIRKLINKL